MILVLFLSITSLKKICKQKSLFSSYKSKYLFYGWCIILLNIEKLQNLEPKPNTRTFVLYLPENEIHDIGLLFVNYELRSRGYHTIFLGESVPVSSLTDLLEFFEEITFISYFTVQPIEKEDIITYIENFKKLVK